MKMFSAANQCRRFASACTEASSACSASASNIVIMMGAMIMASIFAAVIISLIGIIRLPLLVFLPMILVVLGMNER